MYLALIFKKQVMGTRLAKIFSYIFHPVFVPTIGMYYIISFFTIGRLPDALKWLYIFSIFIFTCLFPVITVIVLKLTKQISSLELENKNERRLPMLMSTIYFYFATYLLMKVNILPSISLVMFSGAVALSVATFVSFFYKMSMHVFASASFVAVFLFFAGMGYSVAEVFLYFFILITGIVASARKSLNAHSWGEIVMGLLVGFGVNYIILMILTQFF